MSLSESETTPPGHADNLQRSQSPTFNVYVNNMKRYGSNDECDDFTKKRVKITKSSSPVYLTSTSHDQKAIPVSNPKYSTKTTLCLKKDKVATAGYHESQCNDTNLVKFNDGFRVISSSEFMPTNQKPNSDNITNEYTMFSSDIGNHMESKEQTVTKLTKALKNPICNTTFSYSAKSLELAFLAADNKSPGSTSISVAAYEPNEKNNITENLNEDIIEEIDFVQSIKCAKSITLPIDTESYISKETGALVHVNDVLTSNKLRHNKVTLSRITNVTNAAAGPQTTVALSRNNVHSTLLNQPLLITAKKNMSEVTQTTAKVSIGNTTISVPLLKPLSTKQIIQSGSPIVQTSSHSPAQFNLGKLINVKQSQKSSQPTIFSLSQLQIKPASSAKIVQAKVVNKKSNVQSPRNLASTSGSSRKSVGIAGNEPNLKQGTTTVSALLSNKLLTNSSSQEIQKNFPDDKIICFDSSSGTSAFMNTKKTLVLNSQNLQLLKTNEDLPPTFELEVSKTYKDELGIAIDIANNAANSFDNNAGNKNKTLIPLSKESKLIKSDISTNKESTSQHNTTPESTSFYSTVAVKQSCHATESSTAHLAKALINANFNTNTKTSNIGSLSIMKTKSDASETYSKATNSNLENVQKNSNKTSSADAFDTTALENLQQTRNRSPPGFIAASNQDEYVAQKLHGADATHTNLEESPSAAVTKSTHFAKHFSFSDDTALTYVTKVKNIKCTSTEIVHPMPIADGNDCEAAGAANYEGGTTTILNKDFVKDNRISHLRFQSSSSFNCVAKSDETNNALLKQLLQNSPAYNLGQILPTTSTACTTVTTQSSHKQLLSTRKVISVRAPSLGLVSSLEAQLARPVIPPVPASSESLNHVQQTTQKITQSKLNFEEPVQTRDATVDTQLKSNNKLKVAFPFISKETSFVSNPDLKLTTFKPAVCVKLSVTSSNTGPTISTTKAIANMENTFVESNTKSIESENIAAKNGKYTYTNFGTATQMVQGNGKDSIQHKNAIIKSNALAKEKNSLTKDKSMMAPNVQCLSGPTTEVKYHPQNTGKDEGNILQRNFVNFSNNLEKSPDHLKKPTNLLKKTIAEELREAIPEARAPKSTAYKPKDLPKNEKANAGDTAKTLEVRRKRKREYQKHRRQLTNSKDIMPPAPGVVFTTTTTTTTTSPVKKRSRKVMKAEENYDNFINDLMVRLRVMPPQQVIEPLLNQSYCFCNMYEVRNLLKLKVNKANKDPMCSQLQGIYGKCHVPYLVSNYNRKNDFAVKKAEKKNLHITQNNFYDQEFLPVIQTNEQEKIFRIFRFIDDYKIESIETVHNGNSYNNVNKSIWISAFPGLHLNRNDCNNIPDRMSPIVPPISPAFVKMRRKPLLPFVKRNSLKITTTNPKATRKSRDRDLNRQIVYISLLSSATDKILSALKDLATVLHISIPTTYKISSEDSLTSTPPTKHNKMKKMDNFYDRKFYSCLQNQHLLNGQRKMCSNCGKSINSMGIRACYKYYCDRKIVVGNTKLLTYFCSKLCYTESTSHSDGALIATNQTADYKDRELKNGDITDENYQKTSMQEPLIKECIKNFSPNCFAENMERKRTSETDLTNLLVKMNITISANNVASNASNTLMRFSKDTRQCVFCKTNGDGSPNGPSRLLNFDVNKWVHLNCALWSNDVYETKSGGLMNFHLALQTGLRQICSSCQQTGATVKCFKYRCDDVYHLSCAIKENCVFYKDKTIRCQLHASKAERESELATLMVHRRVFIERDEHGQVATVMYHMELSNLLRVGSLTLLNVGQLLPHQLEAFHTTDYIFPIGYKTIRFYWSMKRPNKRCRYICSIGEVAGQPEFCIQVQEAMEDYIELRNSSPNSIWQRILEAVAATRKKNELVQLFPEFISGEELFGLTEPPVVRILESLPGVDTLSDYRFKYGRNPLLELPLAVNPTGAARTEPKQRQLLAWRKPHTQRTGTSFQRILNPIATVVAGEVACPYSKQFVHSKSSQYKKMKLDWRNNVYLARSKIQGLGLYAARDIEKHTMIIEYIGELIRTEVSEIREKQYEERNHGVYMFRLDEDRVVDATLSGGLARYINHSCNPNCVTEIVEVDRELRIIIFAKRRINRGEELSYDYKFDIEDDANKISCMCESPNCRKWMN